jgi:type IV secretion system protein VirB6
MNPLAALFEMVDVATDTYISDTVANLTRTIDPTFRLLLILFFILYGVAIWRGAIQSSAADFVTKIITVAIVYAMIYNWSLYHQFIVNLLTNGPDALAAAITGETQGSITGAIDRTHFACFDAMMRAFKGDGYVMRYIIGGMILIASTLMVAYAAFLIVLPKLVLSVLVALGPLAFLALLFSGTRRMFDAWFQQCMNFFLYIVFAIMVLALTGAIFEAAVEAIPERADEIVMGTVLPMVLVCVVIWLVLKQIPALASAIAGGIQITTLAAESAPGRALGGILHRWTKLRTPWPKKPTPKNIVNRR